MGGWAHAGRAAVVGWHVAAAGVRLCARLALAGVGARRKTRDELSGRTLAELFAALGPAYVKLGQLLGTRPDLLAPEAIRQLSVLQDRLPPGPFGVVAELFRRELGVEVGEAFAELDPEPLASASVATVYRGRLRDGRAVAVKVRRPDVARRIGTDLGLLRWAARRLGRLPALRAVPVVAAMEEVCAVLERQLDFGREAAASRRLRAALACEPGVVVPGLVDELCGPSLLTMERVEGFGPHRGASGEDARAALAAAVRALYRMIFVEGCIHCDLHHGNLGFLPGGRAAIVDFGFVAEIDGQARKNFARFFYAMATNDGATCARITRNTALLVPPDLDYAAFRAEVVELVDGVARTPAGEFRVAGFVGRLFEVQRRHGLRGTDAFVMPILALLVLEGIVNEVDPGFDFQAEALPYVLHAAVRPTIGAAYAG
ncbi:MAG TPA: AarF/UbiB family protein [Longimicrobium sp.]|nr:AarF/UbiB family protein [Longimicrobium sp.]